MAARRAEGLIALSGGAGRRRRAGARRRATREQAEALARAWAEDFPGAFYLEVQRVDPARDEPLRCRPPSRSPARLGLPVVATHPIQFVQPRRTSRAHEARVCIAQGYVLGDARRPREFRPSSTSSRRPRWRSSSPTCPRRWRTRSRSRGAARSSSRSARAACRTFPRPHGESIEDFLRAESLRGLEARLALLYPDEAARDAARPRYVERLDFEIETIVQMGFPGYFLIVADFINWAQDARRARGPGPRLGRGLAGGLLARHHRPRPAALRAAVRALPQSRARVDAGLRHRLLPGRARSRHRLREAEVRRRVRLADRDLRHHGGEGRGARRGPRARHALRRGRPHRQAGAVRAGHDARAARSRSSRS